MDELLFLLPHEVDVGLGLWVSDEHSGQVQDFHNISSAIWTPPPLQVKLVYTWWLMGNAVHGIIAPRVAKSCWTSTPIP